VIRVPQASSTRAAPKSCGTTAGPLPATDCAPSSMTRSPSFATRAPTPSRKAVAASSCASSRSPERERQQPRASSRREPEQGVVAAVELDPIRAITLAGKLIEAVLSRLSS
jgi:hypothetical protein